MANSMEVKGNVIASIPAFIEKNFGNEGLSKWQDHISEEARQVFSKKTKEDNWYPLTIALTEPMANIAHLFYDWDLKKASWALGRFSADFSISNLKKVFFKVGSTTFFLKKAADFMNGYYRPATITPISVEDGEAIFHITEFNEIEITIEYRIAGWIERVLEIAGNKNISVEVTQSLKDFKPYTEFLVKWE
ncbi:MAG: hypothetical protein KAS21_01210 [Candidatus Aminicenantes bacterium]|nr:hypothetical protein [Candidatus Aminicenantes bacterium]